MALLIRRVALGGLCAALHLASTHAFVPSTSPSSAATRKHLAGSSRLAAVDVRGAARSAGGKAGMAMSAGEHDLFIVGAGYLGKIIGAAWNLEHPEAKNVGETRSYTRHGDFMPPGMRHVRRKDRAAMVEEGIKYPNVVFCANPGGNSDYALEVYRAMQEVWDGTGMFVFTSSGSVYAERKGGVVTEASQIDPAKVDAPLRIAEKVTVQGGGCVVRLAGLYSVQRGPHSVWLNEKRLNHHSKGEINLISYQDAGLAVVAALNAGLAQVRGDEGAREIKGEIFLAADEHPMTRRRICELALAHPLYGRKKMPKFTGDATPPEFVDTGPTKVYDTSWTREMLGWEPKCSSMEEYFTMEREVSLEGRRRAV